MKANFYDSNLAPVNHSHEAQFRELDAVLLVVLFLELAVVIRMILAN
jgi:hypothetical protein